MLRRVYTDIAHFRAPLDPVEFAGLGRVPTWPRGRSYHDVSNFAAPQDPGYFQDNQLFGLGAEGCLEAPNGVLSAGSAKLGDCCRLKTGEIGVAKKTNDPNVLVCAVQAPSLTNQPPPAPPPAPGLSTGTKVALGVGLVALGVGAVLLLRR